MQLAKTDWNSKQEFIYGWQTWLEFNDINNLMI